VISCRAASIPAHGHAIQDSVAGAKSQSPRSATVARRRGTCHAINEVTPEVPTITVSSLHWMTPRSRCRPGSRAALSATNHVAASSTATSTRARSPAIRKMMSQPTVLCRPTWLPAVRVARPRYRTSAASHGRRARTSSHTAISRVTRSFPVATTAQTSATPAPAVLASR
jgi:hypothetical protein